MRKTIGFFEERGKHRLKENNSGRVWYADFLEFQRQEQIFASLLAPPSYGGHRAGTRGASASSTKSWRSMGWRIGTPGRSLFWAWDRSG